MAITEPPVTMRSACSFTACDLRGVENHDSQRSRISEHFGGNLSKGRPLLYWNLQKSNSSAGHLSLDPLLRKAGNSAQSESTVSYQLVAAAYLLPARPSTSHKLSPIRDLPIFALALPLVGSYIYNFPCRQHSGSLFTRRCHRSKKDGSRVISNFLKMGPRRARSCWVG